MVQFCKEHKSSITVSVYVQPNAKKTQWAGPHGDALKLKVAAPPVDGEANAEVIRFLSKFLKIPKNKVQIKYGETSREKVVEIFDITLPEFINLLLKEKILSLSGTP